jgi:hypothetical protein
MTLLATTALALSAVTARADIEILPLKQEEVVPTPVSENKPARASSTWGNGYEASKALDGDTGTRWASAAGHKAGWIEVDLGKPETIFRTVVQEVSFPRVTKFTLEAQQPDGQ